MYLLWRWFVRSSGFVAGELEPLPFAAWNFPLLPEIFASIGRAIFQKAVFFLCLLLVLVAWAPALRRDRWSPESLTLGMIVGITVLFNGFLVFTYIAHFPPTWRCRRTRISAIRRSFRCWSCWASWWHFVPWWQVSLHGNGAWAHAPAWPRSSWSLRCRWCWCDRCGSTWITTADAVANRASGAHYIAPGDRLALLVPGDTDNSVGSMLRGVLMFTPPARPGLDVATETKADAATLAASAAAGYRLALIRCTPGGIDGVPAHVAALLRYDGGGWRVVDSWPYPPTLRHQHFAGLLARGPLCASAAD